MTGKELYAEIRERLGGKGALLPSWGALWHGDQEDYDRLAKRATRAGFGPGLLEELERGRRREAGL